MINEKNFSELNQYYLIEKHKETRNLIFAIQGYLYLLKNEKNEETKKEIIKEIEKLCAYLLKNDEEFLHILLLKLFSKLFPYSHLN